MERAQFFDRLRQSRLLTDPELEQAVSRFGDDEPTQGIADALLREGVLTPFQVRQVYAGDTQPLALGQYRLLDELGRGGMGRVYKALHTIMGRVVAVKVISPELVRDPVAVEWFRREVRASTRLVHPNIVMAYDANEADGLHFLVMEYVPGVTLDALVRQHGPLPVGHACALMRQAALGLQHAHEKGMVHRDIKPGNLLLPRPDGEQPADVLVKIVDFGLARLQGKTKGDTIALRGETGVLGTPDYIAPEQSRDIHAADIRSDLYSLGCAFYFCLAGRVPFPGDNAMEKLIKHLSEEAEPLERVRPDVPRALAAVVRRMMAKDPARRPQTPAELAEELEGWAAEGAKGATSTKTPQRPFWITPPTQIGAAPNVPPGPTGHTRVLDGLNVFAPSGRPAPPSGPSLLEPLCEGVASELRPGDTHDTLSLSLAADTGEPRAADNSPAPDADPTAPEVSAAPAAGPTPTEQEVRPVLRAAWGRWRGLVETIVAGRGPSAVNPEDYRTLHALLLQACREAVESAAAPERRAFYQELLSVAQPWLNLQTFLHTEPQMLDALLRCCKQAELELNDGKAPWTARQVVALVLLALSPVALALWYYASGRLWLPSLLRAFHRDSSAPSLRSGWQYVQAHPSLLMGVIFPVAVIFSVYLLWRSPRA